MTSREERKKVLVIDDESNVRESLRLILSKLYEVDVAESSENALKLLESINKTTAASAEGRLPDLVVLDMIMPGLDGLGLLEKLRSDYPALPVIMLTASNSVKTAVQAMKFGAIDYLNKPFEVDELLGRIEENLTQAGANLISGTFKYLRPEMPKIDGDFGTMVGKNPVLQDLYRRIDQLAVRDTTVLVTGESGTGKELVAREIHKRSKRGEGPFIALNCAAIPESLIESELFGHEKGAFTHAVEKRVGHFELAHGGTLFLDEIGELSLPIQVKMLRFLQEQEFYRVGRSKPIRVDVRVLAATNKNLELAVKEARFRQDLFYRIHVVTLDLPPLRERADDIPLLLTFFVNRMGAVYGNRKLTFTPEVMKLLESYSWPGNVRELENVVESLLVLSPNDEITVAELPTKIRQTASTGDLSSDVLTGNIPFEEAERAFETELILKALNKTNYVQTKAAEVLGISRRILKYKMDKLGISDKPNS